MDNRIIGMKIRRLRHAQNITSVELGARAGISQAQVSRLESGKQGFRSATLTRIAEALGVKPVFFFIDEAIGEDEKMKSMSLYGAIAHPRLTEALTSPEFLGFLEMAAIAYKDNVRNWRRLVDSVRQGEKC